MEDRRGEARQGDKSGQGRGRGTEGGRGGTRGEGACVLRTPFQSGRIARNCEREAVLRPPGRALSEIRRSVRTDGQAWSTGGLERCPSGVEGRRAALSTRPRTTRREPEPCARTPRGWRALSACGRASCCAGFRCAAAASVAGHSPPAAPSRSARAMFAARCCPSEDDAPTGCTHERPNRARAPS